MLEDFIVGLIKFVFYVLVAAVIVAFACLALLLFVATTTSSWWYTIPGGLVAVWFCFKILALATLGIGTDALPFTDLIKWLVLYSFVTGAIFLISLTTIATWWYTIPGVIILVILALFWLNTVFEFYVPGFDKRDGLGGDGGPEIWDN